ncbi:hypothetical protein ES705_46092 [subsurface metagenome]
MTSFIVKQRITENRIFVPGCRAPVFKKIFKTGIIYKERYLFGVCLPIIAVVVEGVALVSVPRGVNDPLPPGEDDIVRNHVVGSKPAGQFSIPPHFHLVFVQHVVVKFAVYYSSVSSCIPAE